MKALPWLDPWDQMNRLLNLQVIFIIYLKGFPNRWAVFTFVLYFVPFYFRDVLHECVFVSSLVINENDCVSVSLFLILNHQSVFLNFSKPYPINDRESNHRTQIHEQTKCQKTDVDVAKFISIDGTRHIVCEKEAEVG